MTKMASLTDREAAIDAVMRFVWSLDEGDSDLCASSLTEEAVMDLSPLRKAGLGGDSVYGREKIVEVLMSKVGKPLDTTHSATNIRCTVDGDIATLKAVILAQHFRLGEGPSPDHQDYFFIANKYDATIIRDGDVWRMNCLTITPAWSQGNPEVMKV